MTDRKVVFVNRFFYPDHSATSQMLTDLALDLAEAGKTVEIVASRLRYDDPTAQLPHFEIIQGVSVHRVWTSRFGRGNLAGRAIDYLTFYATAAWKLWRRTNANTIVVVKTDPPLISIVAAPIVRLRGAKLVNWLQDIFPELASALGVRVIRGPLFGLLKWARNSSLRAAHMNVILGVRMEALVHSQGVPMAQIRVIPNWADGEAIKPVPREENLLRKTWNLQDKFVVGYSGNLGRAHEFDTILYAAEYLKNRRDIVFLFIGGGAQRGVVEQQANRLKLSTVQFQPYQSRKRLSESLSVADVHLLSLNPALEGLIVPSKFYGIAAAGRPTIFVGDPEGEISLALLESCCGSTVNVGKGIDLANIIVEFADDPTLCKRQGSNARVMFEKKFDRIIAMRAWTELLSHD